MRKKMVLLDHPCFGIDIWDVETDEDTEIARRQGYVEMPEINGGVSTCPICGRRWVVTQIDDCMLPACGCYGGDVSESNLSRPCHRCGILHLVGCTKRR